ncbi:hypothetical protein [Nocardioides sp. YIM 152315]|uniref:hypothetical protein n=1 Tax=Nocardioides sp. YIM 152315 TaxID=3031760 RepID=UPI0023DB821E|nr:hypothetical protein [Nocardioides sp. YIM 152315]MDF1604428.1 hypothetical protein [Nocardioides sp. YIM 152315]
MTLTATPSRTARGTTVHVVHDPHPGQQLSVPAGARLAVRFRRRGLGLSRWQVVERPGYLLPLEEGPHGFLFLVFDVDGATDEQPLRLVRRRVDRSGPGEVRDLVVRVG